METENFDFVSDFVRPVISKLFNCSTKKIVAEMCLNVSCLVYSVQVWMFDHCHLYHVVKA